jgi:hypothetical protein
VPHVFPGDLTLFGPEEFTIKRFPLLFSIQRFRVGESVEAMMTITLNTPGKRIRAGFVVLNRQFIRLRRVFSRDSLIVEREVRVRRRNRLWVLLDCPSPWR